MDGYDGHAGDYLGTWALEGHMGVFWVALVRYCQQMHYDMPDASLADFVMFTI